MNKHKPIVAEPHNPSPAYAEIPPPGAAPLPEPIAALVDRVASAMVGAGIPPARLLPADALIRVAAESDRIYHLDCVTAGLLIEQMRERIAAIPRVPGQVGVVRAKYAGAWYIRVEVATCGRK